MTHLTRRPRHRPLAAIGLLVAVGLGSSCHEKLAPSLPQLPAPQAGETQVPLRIEPPAGSSIDASSLSLVAGIHAAGSSGSTGLANLSANSTQLVAAVSPAGNPVLLLTVPGGSSSARVMDVASTAEALVFLCPLIASPRLDSGAARLSRIRAAASFPALVETLQQRMLADAYGALVDSSVSLENAIQAVVSEVLSGSGTSGAASGPTIMPRSFIPDDQVTRSGVRVSAAGIDAQGRTLIRVENTWDRFVSIVTSYSSDGVAYASSTDDNGPIGLPLNVLDSKGPFDPGATPAVALALRNGPPYARIKVFGLGVGGVPEASADPDFSYATVPIAGTIVFDLGVPLFEVITGINGLDVAPIWNQSGDVGLQWIDAAAQCLSTEPLGQSLEGQDMGAIARATVRCAIRAVGDDPALAARLLEALGVSTAVTVASTFWLPFRIVFLVKSIVEFTVSGFNVASANVMEVFPLSDPTKISISNVSPASGALSGGTPLTITGTNFTSLQSVTVGGAALLNQSVVGSTQIAGNTPVATQLGAVDVVVTSAAGKATCTACFAYVPSMSVSGITPNSGPLAGGTPVTVTGTGFPTPVDSVRVGAARLIDLVRIDGTHLTGSTPPGTAAGAADVTVYASVTGTATCAGCFAYYAPLAVTGVLPYSGPTAGGTLVAITGQGFVNITGIAIGGAALSNWTVVSSTQILGTTPPSSTPGTTDVVVSTGSNGSATCKGFVYGDPPPRVFASSGQWAALVGSTGPSDLYDVPPVPCGTDRLIGHVSTSSGFQPLITDLAMRPAGTLWAIGFDSLYRIDPATATATSVGALGVGGANALAIDANGVLYGAGNTPGILGTPGLFFRVDTVTGAATVIGSFGSGWSSSGDLAFGPGGQLYATSSTSSGDALVTVDTTTGTATPVNASASIGFTNVWGLKLVGLELFGLTSSQANSSSGALIAIDLSTGIGNWVRNLSFNATGASAPPSQSQTVQQRAVKLQQRPYRRSPPRVRGPQ